MRTARGFALLWLVALGFGLSATACRNDPGAEVQRAQLAGPTFVSDSFDQLYPLFLMRQLSPARKAELWHQYLGKYVRWSGTVVSFTPDGITFKQIRATITFDVSLQLEPTARDKRKRLKPGDTVIYVGRLSSYDDIFRTFYLDHGDLAVAP